VAASYRASACVIRALVLAYPEGPGILDPKSGAAAIHMMCNHGSSAEGFRAILETDAGAKSVQNIHALLKILYGKSRIDFFSTSRILRRTGDTGSGIGGRGVRVPERIVDKCKMITKSESWQKTALLVKAGYTGSALARNEDATRRVVHACAGIRDCPQALMDLAVRLYPQQLVERDDEGQVPLHKVVAKSDWTLFYDVFCHEAARICDRNGKYPLQIAAETGHHSWGTEFGLPSGRSGVFGARRPTLSIGMVKTPWWSRNPISVDPSKARTVCDTSGLGYLRSCYIMSSMFFPSISNSTLSCIAFK
jgi:hypothetical protein